MLFDGYGPITALRRFRDYLRGGSGPEYEIEFRWKEEVIYWEGIRGCVFPGGWGVDPLETYVPDAETWDRAVPGFLRGRHDEILARLRSEQGHIVKEEHDDSQTITRYPEITR